jgi:hypothetical protein
MTKPDIDAQERVLLFCLGSGTDWKEVGLTFKTVAGLLRKPWELAIPLLVPPYPLSAWSGLPNASP